MINMLVDLNITSVVIRVFLSIVVGGVLGMERQRKNRPAGFRTYMLVCLGASLIMMTNQYVYEMYQIGDPVRMGAQVVSGIGFLGAGAIMVTGRHQIKGITTAAGLWASACLGLAIGIGFYEGAILGAASVFIIMSLLQKFEDKMQKSSELMEIYVEIEAGKSFGDFLNYIRENGIEITGIDLNRDSYSSRIGTNAVLNLKFKDKRNHSEVMEFLRAADGIWYIEEI